MASARLESSEEVSDHQEDSEADLETIQVCRENPYDLHVEVYNIPRGS